MDILEDRYGNGSTIIAPQLPVDSWYTFIDEPTLAEAIMDSLSATAHRIALTGQSHRKKNNPKFQYYHGSLVRMQAGLAGVLCSGINGELCRGTMGYFRRNIQK